MDGSDRALLERLRRGERGAFDALYAAHHARVWAFLARLAGRRALAEDLFQETWLQAARHAHRLEPDARVLPWLLTIARNAHRSARRFVLFDLRKREALAVEPMAVPPGPDVQAEVRAEAARLERAFGRLSDAHREVLLLAVVEGLSHAELAGALGVREDAARKRLSRARAALADALARDDAGRRTSR